MRWRSARAPPPKSKKMAGPRSQRGRPCPSRRNFKCNCLYPRRLLAVKSKIPQPPHSIGGNAILDNLERIDPTMPDIYPDSDEAAPKNYGPLQIFDVGDEDGKIAPRQWLLGTVFCRGTLSGLISQGAAGKTTYRILQAIALCAGQNLTGDYVHVRCRILIVCLEDDLPGRPARAPAASSRGDAAPRNQARRCEGLLIFDDAAGPQDSRTRREGQSKGRSAARCDRRRCEPANSRPSLPRPRNQGAFSR